MGLVLRRCLPALTLLALQAVVVIKFALDAVPLDYRVEADAAFAALAGGDLSQFLNHCPAYCGSLVLRAPAVVPADWLFGDATARYIVAAVTCAFATTWLGAYVVQAARKSSARRSAGWWAALVVVASPITVNAFRAGHPEEVLVGVGVVAAVLAAAEGRTRLAGVLLGCAIAAKPWAVVAVGPVLLTTRGSRLSMLCWAVGAGALLALPSYLHQDGGFAQATAVAQYAGPQVRPPQVWWFLGDPGPEMISRFGEVLEGYRTPPEWVLRVTHPAVVAVAFALAAVVWLRHRRLDLRQGLLLLAAVLLIRGMLDTWNFPYYEAPFLFAIVAWELHAHRGAARRSLLICALLSFSMISSVTLGMSADAQAVAFLAWSVPVLGLMVRSLVAAPATRARVDAAPAGLRRVASSHQTDRQPRPAFSD